MNPDSNIANSPLADILQFDGHCLIAAVVLYLEKWQGSDVGVYEPRRTQADHANAVRTFLESYTQTIMAERRSIGELSPSETTLCRSRW